MSNQINYLETQGLEDLDMESSINYIQSEEKSSEEVDNYLVRLGILKGENEERNEENLIWRID